MHMQCFDMSMVDIARRNAEWNRVQREAHGAVSLQMRKADFVASIQLCDVGAMQYSHIRSDPSHVVSGRVAEGMSPRLGWFVLLNREGACEIEIGRRTRIFPENSVIWVPTKKVFELEFRQPSISGVLHVPELPASFDPRRLVGAPLDLGDHPLFASAIQILQKFAVTGRQPSPRYSQVVTSLIELCLEEGGAAQLHLTHAQWIVRLAEFVDRNLGGEGLSLDLAGDHFRVSSRLIGRILKNEGHNFVSFVTMRRLHVAQRLLVEELHLSITEVAYSVGFNDLSYFCRKFKAEFGVSARDFRNGMRGQLIRHRRVQ